MRPPKTARPETAEEKINHAAAYVSLWDREMTEQKSDDLVGAYNATAQLPLMTRAKLRAAGNFGALPRYTEADKKKGLKIVKIETGIYTVA